MAEDYILLFFYLEGTMWGGLEIMLTGKEKHDDRPEWKMSCQNIFENLIKILCRSMPAQPLSNTNGVECLLLNRSKEECLLLNRSRGRTHLQIATCMPHYLPLILCWNSTINGLPFSVLLDSRLQFPSATRFQPWTKAHFIVVDGS